MWAAANVKKIEITPDDASKKAYFAQPVRIWGTHGYKAAADSYNALVTLSNAKTSFVFHLQGKMLNGIPHAVQIGMVRPSVFNWYAGGFVTVRFAKTQLLDGNLAFGEIKAAKDGSSACAEFKYTSGEYAGTIRMELADDDDKLAMTFTPTGKKSPYELSLVAYPGAYGEKNLRKREIATTANGRCTDGKYVLDKKDCYVVFYDSYYDSGNGRGDGCCAFLFNPQEISAGTIRCGYGCTAYLSCKPGVSANLVLWDFKKWSAGQARDYMKNLNVKFE